MDEQRLSKIRVLKSEGKSYRQIAALIGSTPDAIKSVVYRNRAKPPPPPADALEAEVVEELHDKTIETDPLTEEQVARECGQAPAEASDGAPAIMSAAEDRYLLIPDLQIPFEHPNALAFMLSVQREFRIPTGNVICVGDETDQYFASLYPHDPDAAHSPNSELAEARARLARWYRAFPRMRLCNSNHGDRWLKKAAAAQIPSQLMRAYRDLINAPLGWVWAERWSILTRHPFDVEHGHHGAQGIYAHRQKALDNGRSLAHGHLHASAGISHVRTGAESRWGMNVGCLIDVDAYAFHYGRRDRFKPWLGCGVVLNEGSTPILVPYGR